MKKFFFFFMLIAINFCVMGQKCPMEDVDKWQTTLQSTDSKSQVDALTELVAAANGDIAQVQGLLNSAKADAKLKLSWSLSKEAKKKKYKETIWDKDVWHEIKQCRTAYCALWGEIKAGLYDTPEGKKKALAQLETTRNYLLTAKKKLENSTAE